MRFIQRITLFTFIFVFCLPIVFVSQTNDRQVQLMEEVKRLNVSEKYHEVLALLQPALEESKKSSDWQGHFEISKAISNAWFSLAKHDSACYFLENELAFLSKSGRMDKSETARLMNFLASNYANQELYIPAFEAYQRAIGIFEKIGDLGKYPAYSYKNIAQIYVRWDNFTLANQCLEAAIKIDTSGTLHAEIYSQIANCYHFQGDEVAVLRNYELGMADPKRSEKNTAHLQATGASAFIARGQYDKAIQMLEAASKYYQANRTYWQDNLLECLTTLADIAIRQHQPQAAERYFQRAATEARNFYTLKSREVAKLYIETGLFYENAGQLDRALRYYQQALVQAFPKFNSLNTADNPALAEAWLESQAMRAAAAKAQVLLKMAVKRKTSTDLRLNAAHCFDLSFAVAARLRHTYGNDADKIALSANNRRVYQAAVLNLWQLWKESRDPLQLEHLLALIEQTKAQALVDALQQQKALALTGIPDSLLQQESMLRLEAAEVSRAYEQLEKGQDSAKAEQLKWHAFRQKKAYDDFIGYLGEQYPQFQQYSEADGLVEVAAIRQSIPDSTLLLSWFDAGDRFLCLRSQGTALTAVEVARDTAFDHSLLDFISLLSDLNRQQTAPALFFAKANALYQKLFPNGGLDGLKSLLIVPDGLLCYLPFEVLLTAPHEQGGFASAPYLFQKCAVSYAWSAKLLTSHNAESEAHGLVQFAPFASTSRDQLAVLSNSLSDVPRNLSRNVLEGGDATSATFLKIAPENNVLHLSTHAQVGKNGAPGIEFFDRTLTLPEIYAQRFHASLVSLSACETGAGTFAGGEGVLSLARAFAYAGAQSMVASLWSVNDRATASLFSAFYKNLKNGKSKSEALRQAKMSCLTAPESDARKAPYYWAAFTLTGVDGTVDMSPGWTGLFRWGILALVLSMIVFWGFRKRRKQREDGQGT